MRFDENTSALPIFRPQTDTPSSASSPRSFHLKFLDGIRGLTALYVILYHASQEINVFVPGGPTPLMISIYRPLRYGHLAVDIFIVLSGYCLMLPVVQSGTTQLRGGFKDYISRRAKRILPPYFAALTIFLLLLLALPVARQSHSTSFFLSENAWTSGNLFSHLLLLQNLQARWAWSIDAPMWSVATEWQIYFIFPLLLLPVWRRRGNRFTVALSLFVSLIPALLMPWLSQACLWYIALFTFGMVAATYRENRSPAAIRRCYVLAITLGALGFFGTFVVTEKETWAIDFLIGGATSLALITLADSAQRQSPNTLRRLFETRLALWLGMFSYSIYLVHFPVLSLLHLALNVAHVAPEVSLMLMLTLGTVVSLLVSYLFFMFFERPSLTLKHKAFLNASQWGQRWNNRTFGNWVRAIKGEHGA